MAVCFCLYCIWIIYVYILFIYIVFVCIFGLLLLSSSALRGHCTNKGFSQQKRKEWSFDHVADHWSFFDNYTDETPVERCLLCMHYSPSRKNSVLTVTWLLTDSRPPKLIDWPAAITQTYTHLKQSLPPCLPVPLSAIRVILGKKEELTHLITN